MGAAAATLLAACLAADVSGVPTILVARTDADAADMITSDVDERDAEFITGRAHRGGLLPHQPRRRAGDRPRARLRPLRRPDLVRDLRARPRARAPLRRSGARAVPRQEARLQLLALLQLEVQALRRRDRGLPGRTGQARLRLPVRDAGRLPLAQPVDVRARERLPRQRHEGVLRAAAEGVRRRSAASRRPSTSARSAPATSTTWPRSSPAARSTGALEGSTEQAQFAS